MLRLLTLLFLAAPPARAAYSVPGFELVYSYPIETALAEPDLRQTQDVWPEMFDAAQRTIDIEHFYATPSPGEPLEASLQALERAAKRGVRIRFILEKQFEKQSADGIARLKSIPGLDLRILSWTKASGDGIIHAKFFVVDSSQAYVGSENFDWRSLKHIHETGLAISAPDVVKQVHSVFEHDWSLSGSTHSAKPDNTSRPETDRSGRAYLVASPWRMNPPGVGDSESELVELIGESKDSLLIQLLVYSPTSYKSKRFYSPIDNALRDAAVRGVKVKLLVSHWNTAKPAIDHLKSLSLLPGVEVRIITIPEAKQGRIPFARTAHSKYMIVDGKTLWMGTSNWGGGYMDTSRNLEVVVKDEALAARALKIHARLWGSPHTAPLEPRRAYSKPRR